MSVNQNLKEYISDPNLVSYIPFAADELNEPILTAYNILKWVIRDQCTLIEISPKQIVWKKSTAEVAVGQFTTPINFIPIFESVVNRDKSVSKYLQPIEIQESKVNYKIL